MTIDELVDGLLRTETATGIDQNEDPTSLALRLHHIDLPKLEEHGVVEFDADSGRVRYRSHERIESVLDSLSENVSQATH